MASKDWGADKLFGAFLRVGKNPNMFDCLIPQHLTLTEYRKELISCVHIYDSGWHLNQWFAIYKLKERWSVKLPEVRTAAFVTFRNCELFYRRETGTACRAREI